MTRINLIPVQELTNKHLIAEKHEITRVFSLAKTQSHLKFQIHIGWALAMLHFSMINWLL